METTLRARPTALAARRMQRPPLARGKDGTSSGVPEAPLEG